MTPEERKRELCALRLEVRALRASLERQRIRSRLSDDDREAAPRSIAEVRRLARQLLTGYERRQQHKMRAQNG